MAVERISRTQRDLQRLDGRRGPKAKHAVTWGDIDELLAEIAVRSKASGGKFTKAIGAGDDIKFEDILGELDVDKIVSPVIGAPTGLTISSSVNEETGISFIYVDWDDVEGSSGYELGFVIDGGGEFVVPAPTSFFQNSVIAGQTITVRLRSINALNVPGPWSSPVSHVAQEDTTPPPVPTGLEITPAFNGFWIKWDRSPAADIARYEVYESSTPTPAPTASTNPTFTSASPVFFRGSLPNGATRYYWIRAVDYSENASAWSARITATTVTDPGELLDLLQGQITESQLFADLGARINLIDGPAAMLGSVAQRLAAEAQTRADEIAAEALARGTAITNEQTLRQSADDALAQQIETISSVAGSNTAAIQTEQTARATADNVIATDVTALDTRMTTAEGNVSANASAVSSLDSRVTSAEGAISSTSSDLTALQNTVNNPSTGVSANAAGVTALSTAVGDLDDGIAAVSGRTTALEATVNNPTTGVTATAGALDTLETAVNNSVSGLSATATKVNNLQATINDPVSGLAQTYAALQQEADVRADQTGDLFAQYTVKTDLNGYVSGFGLASQAPVDGTPSSSFIVRADTFSIANPSGPSISPQLPFIVRTSGTVIGGQYVPPGVYIRDGFIQNGTISNATIADATITDAKIQELSATKLIAGTQIANNITVNGQALGTIQNNADNPAARINAASTNILPGKITLTGAATLLNWTASADRTKIDGGRIYTNSIEADSIDTTSLAADSAFITNLTSTGTSFMNQLLVKTANIDDAAIKTAKIDDLAVDTLKIQDNAVSVPLSQTLTSQIVGNGAYQEVQFLWHTMDEPGEVMIIWSGGQGYSSGDTNVSHQLRIGGSPTVSRGGLFANDTAVILYSTFLNAGTRKFSIFWKANSTVTHFSRTMTILGVKK